MQRTACFLACYAVVANMAPAQVAQKVTVAMAGRADFSVLRLREPRRLSPGAAVCVNPPLNLIGGEIESDKAGEQLAEQIRGAGFASGLLGSLSSCDAVVFTEITKRSPKGVELDFRIVLSDEQVPRLCSSARGKSGKLAPWRDAVLGAFAEEARQIRNAQQKGMAAYAGAVE